MDSDVIQEYERVAGFGEAMEEMSLRREEKFTRRNIILRTAQRHRVLMKKQDAHLRDPATYELHWMCAEANEDIEVLVRELEARNG